MTSGVDQSGNNKGSGMTGIECVVRANALLGEGSLWDAARGVLWWLDIKGFQLHSFDPLTGLDSAVPLTTRVTALALTIDGTLLASGDGGIGIIDVASGDFKVASPLVLPAGYRFNDGKVDGQGRFWVGSMDDEETGDQGGLFRRDASGAVAQVAGGLRIPNGPAFDASGCMYLADSALQTIYRYPAAFLGEEAKRVVFARFGEGQGYPDGMTCDDEDHLWVAVWGGGCVRRFAPDGSLVREIAMPVSQPTSVAFGGAALDTLFVTSATVGLSPQERAAQPDAGGLFRLEPGVKGRLPNRLADCR
jgi:xylono-1,5-lactonase